MADKWIYIGDKLTSFPSASGTNTYGDIKARANWVPQWGEREALRIHSIKAYVQWNYASSAISRSGELWVVDQPLPLTDVMPVAGAYNNPIKDHGPRLLLYYRGLHYNIGAQYFHFQENLPHEEVFRVPRIALGLSLSFLPWTNTPANMCYIRVNYERITLSVGDWNMLLMKNQWLMSGKDPVTTTPW